MEKSDLKARVYMLEKMNFYQDGNTPETLFLTDMDALKDDLSKLLDDEEDDNAKKDAWLRDTP